MLIGFHYLAHFVASCFIIYLRLRVKGEECAVPVYPNASSSVAGRTAAYVTATGFKSEKDLSATEPIASVFVTVANYTFSSKYSGLVLPTLQHCEIRPSARKNMSQIRKNATTKHFKKAKK